MTAEIVAGGRVRLAVGAWSDIFDRARLPAWTAWYAKMAEDYPRGRYQEVAAALRALPAPGDR